MTINSRVRFLSPAVSPDGRHLAFLAPHNDQFNVWLAPHARMPEAMPLTRSLHGVRTFSWAYDSRHICFTADTDGDENHRVGVADTVDGSIRWITPGDGVEGSIVKLSARHPGQILVSHNKRDAKYADLYRVSLATGQAEIVCINQGFYNYIVDEDLSLRLVTRHLDNGSVLYLAPTANGWRPFMTVDLASTDADTPLSFDSEGRNLFMLDSRERDTAALVSVAMETGGAHPVAGHQRYDCVEALFNPLTAQPQAVAFAGFRKTWRFLDPALRTDWTLLTALGDGDVSILSRSLDDRYWTVAFEQSHRPRRFYLLDRHRRSTVLLGEQLDLDEREASPLLPTAVTSRDGWSLPCYYALPPAFRDRAKPDRPLPLVLLPHGGPWTRDHWRFNQVDQWLTSRGCAVLRVNFRGSTGFGKAFTAAGDLEWGRRMQHDLDDAVDWAVAQGIADRERIAIVGQSYGGYAALAGLAFTPDRFACAVSICGPSDLVSHLEALPPSAAAYRSWWLARVGNVDTTEGRELLRSRSPAQFADCITRPLLMFHGANDPRVRHEQSERMVEVLRDHAIPVTHVVFPDEGHGIQKTGNSDLMFALMEVFLAKHLGIQSDPLRDELQRSSASIVVDRNGLTTKGSGW